MNEWIAKKENRTIIISVSALACFVIILVLAAVIVVRMESSEFDSTRAAYEENLHAIEGYIPEDSPIDHVQVDTIFSQTLFSYYNDTVVSVYLKEDMKYHTDREVLLILYPYDSKIRELAQTMKDKSGFEAWMQNNTTDGRIVGKHMSAGSVHEELSIIFITPGDVRMDYEIDEHSFTARYNEKKMAEYHYVITNNQLTDFRQTYPKPEVKEEPKKKEQEEDSKENKGNKGTSSSRYTTKKSDKSSSGSSESNKKYDYYNVYDYDCAWDFADDKYEEFMDYEDEYDDEDEAFEAAEDYWREHHR